MIARVEIDFLMQYNFLIRIQSHQDLLKLALSRLRSVSPKFYPKALYKYVFMSTDILLNLTYTMDVETNRNYSI